MVTSSSSKAVLDPDTAINQRTTDFLSTACAATDNELEAMGFACSTSGASNREQIHGTIAHTILLAKRGFYTQDQARSSVEGLARDGVLSDVDE